MPKERAVKTTDVSSEWGQPAWIYSDGSVRGERGKMLKALAGGNKITPANASAYAEMRVNKVQEAIQTALVQAGLRNNLPAASAADVLAAGAGLLWDQVVINGERTTIRDGDSVLTTGASARDRLAVLEQLGKRAGLLEDKREAAPAASVMAGLLELALAVAARRGVVVDADSVTDAEVAEAE
jgi:hypothetical protein